MVVKVFIFYLLILSLNGNAYSEDSLPAPQIHPWLRKTYTQKLESHIKKHADPVLATRLQHFFESLDPQKKVAEANPHYLSQFESLTKEFRRYCFIKDEKLVFEKNIGRTPGCEIILWLNQLSCYQAYLKQDIVFQSKTCSNYQITARVLTRLDPKSKKFKIALDQAKLFELDAKSQQVFKSNEHRETKLIKLKNISETFPKIQFLTEPELRYDGWAVYSRHLAIRAQIEKLPKSKQELLLRALSANQHQSYERKSDKNFNFFVFHHGSFAHHNQIYLLSQAKDLKGVDLKVDSIQDEILTDWKRYQEKEWMNIKELSEMVHLIQVTTNDIKNVDFEFIDGLSYLGTTSKDESQNPSKTENPEDLIREVQKLIQNWINDHLNKYNQPPKNQEEWRKRYELQAVIDLLRSKILPHTISLSMRNLSKLKEIFNSNSQNLLSDLKFVYFPPHEKYQSKFTQSEFSEIYVLKTLLQSPLDLEKSKAVLEQLIYRSLIKKKANDLKFFHSETDSILAKLYQHPMSSEWAYMRFNANNNLDLIYKDWLIHQIHQYQDKAIAKLHESKTYWEKASAFVHQEIAKKTMHEIKTLDYQRLDQIFESSKSSFLNFFQTQLKLFDANKVLDLNFDDPLKFYVILELKNQFLSLTKNDYLALFEKHVLNKNLIQYDESLLRSKLEHSLKELGYFDLPVDFLLTQLKDSQTSLGEVYFAFLRQKLNQLVKQKANQSTSDFEKKNTAQVLSKLHTHLIEPQIEKYKVEHLKSLIEEVERPNVDLDLFVKKMTDVVKLDLQSMTLSDAQKFIWIKALYDIALIQQNQYKAEIQNLLVLKNKNLFSDPTFRSFLENELVRVGYAELDAEFILTRLKNHSANLAQLLIEFRKLPEAKEKHYEAEKKLPSKQSFLTWFKKPVDRSGDPDGDPKVENNEKGKREEVFYFYHPGIKTRYFAETRYKSTDGRFFIPIKQYQKTESLSQVLEQVDEQSYLIVPPNLPLKKAIVPDKGFLIRPKSKNNEWMDESPSSYTVIPGVQYKVGLYPDPKKTGQRVQAISDPKEYDQYYLKDQIKVDLDSNTENVVTQLYVFYQDLKAAKGNKEAKDQVLIKWRDYLHEQFEKNKVPGLIIDLNDFIDRELFSEESYITYGENDAEFLLLKSLEKWLAISYDYIKVGTAEVTVLDESHPQWGDELKKSIQDKKGNCAQINALYQHIVKRYYHIPARYVGGYTSSGQVNDGTFSDNYVGWKFIDAKRNGHSWSEVLIDGQWERMDATPMEELQEKKLALGSEEQRALKRKFKFPNWLTRDPSASKNRMNEKRKKEEDVVTRIYNEILKNCEQDRDRAFQDSIHHFFIYDVTKIQSIDLPVYQQVLERLIKNKRDLNCVYPLVFSVILPKGVLIESTDSSSRSNKVVLNTIPTIAIPVVSQREISQLHRVKNEGYNQALKNFITHFYDFNHSGFKFKAPTEHVKPKDPMILLALLNGLNGVPHRKLDSRYLLNELGPPQNLFDIVSERLQKQMSSESVNHVDNLNLIQFMSNNLPVFLFEYLKKYQTEALPKNSKAMDLQMVLGKFSNEKFDTLIDIFHKELISRVKDDLINWDCDFLEKLAQSQAQNAKQVREAYLSRLAGKESWFNDSISHYKAIFTFPKIEEHPDFLVLIKKLSDSIQKTNPFRLQHTILKNDVSTEVSAHLMTIISDFKNLQKSKSYQDTFDREMLKQISQNSKGEISKTIHQPIYQKSVSIKPKDFIPIPANGDKAGPLDFESYAKEFGIDLSEAPPVNGDVQEFTSLGSHFVIPGFMSVSKNETEWFKKYIHALKRYLHPLIGSAVDGSMAMDEVERDFKSFEAGMRYRFKPSLSFLAYLQSSIENKSPSDAVKGDWHFLGNEIRNTYPAYISVDAQKNDEFAMGVIKIKYKQAKIEKLLEGPINDLPSDLVALKPVFEKLTGYLQAKTSKTPDRFKSIDEVNTNTILAINYFYDWIIYEFINSKKAFIQEKTQPLFESIEKNVQESFEKLKDSQSGLFLAGRKKAKILSEDAEIVSGYPVSCYYEEVFDVVGAYTFLRDLVPALEEAQAYKNLDSCLRMSYMLIEIDQALQNKTPEGLEEDFKKFFHHIEDSNDQLFSVFTEDLKDELVSWLQTIYNKAGAKEKVITIDPSSIKDTINLVLNQMSYEELQKNLIELLKKQIDQYQEKCGFLVSDFFKNSAEPAHRKNWIHLQTLILKRKLDQKQAPSRYLMNQLMVESRILKRSSFQERSVTPKSLELFISVLPFYLSQKQQPGLLISNQQLMDQAKSLLAFTDLTDTEVENEVKRILLKLNHIYQKQSEQPILELVETLFERVKKLPSEKRLRLLQWWIMAEEIIVKEDFKDFFIHSLSRIPIEDLKVHDPLIHSRYDRLAHDLRELLGKGSHNSEALKSLVHAAKNALRLKGDTGASRKFLELLLESELDFSKNLTPEIKSHLKDYFIQAQKTWHQEDYEKYSEHSQAFLKRLGVENIEFKKPILKDW